MSLGQNLRALGMLWGTRAFLRTGALLGDPTAQIIAMRPGSDPYPRYERARAQGDFARSRLGMYVVTSHAAANAILREPRFGVARRVELMQVDRVMNQALGSDRPVHPVDDSFLSLDPPRHTRLRRTVAPWFTPRALRERTPAIEALVDRFLDELHGREHWDLIEDFAVRVPIKVICDLFGIPAIDYPRFSRWGAVLGASLDGVRSMAELGRLRATLVEMEAFFDELIQRRVREPGDDVVSGVIAANQGDEPLAGEDIVATCQLLLVAGFETTVNLIGNGVLALVSHPEARREFLAAPELADNVVEEVLRFDPPVQYTARIANEPVSVAGRDLPADSMVAVLLAAANRDPEVFDRPHVFDPTRENSREHLAFSAGIHYCLGANLARIEGAAALRALFTRFPDLRLAGPVTRRNSRNIRGALRLPVRTATRHTVTVGA